MSKTIMTVLLIVLLAATGCSINSEENGQKVKQEEVKNQKQDKVTVTAKKENTNTEFFDIEINLPQVSDMQNKEAQAELNKQFTSIYKLRDSLQQEAKQAAVDAAQNDIPFRPYQLVADYNISYNKNGLFSLTETIYTYTGGAHGITTKKTYNVDINSGKPISLQSMFKDGVDYKDLINQEISKQIAENPDKYFTGDMGFKTIADDQNFYIQEGEIVIYFSQYEIAPYASGIPEFEIRLNQFGDSLKTEYRPEQPAGQ